VFDVEKKFGISDFYLPSAEHLSQKNISTSLQNAAQHETLSGSSKGKY